MSNLGPQQQNNTYDGLLQVDGGISSTLKPVQDGMGNMAGLWLSSTGASVTTSDTFIASVDGTQIPNSVPRLISDGFGDYVSVKDFGAVGDGVTDDTTAFNNAASAASIIFIPPGTYRLNSSVSNTKTWLLLGDVSFVGGGALGGGLIDFNKVVSVYRTDFIEGFTVKGNINGSNTFMRAYTDTTSFYSTGTGGYTSYDTLAYIGNGTTDPHYNHSYGYEARQTFRGNNGIDNLFGFYSGLTVNGGAGSAIAAATNTFGFMCGDAGGTGTIYRQAAFYCNDLTRGTYNNGIYLGLSAGANKYNIYAIGTAQNHIEGPLTLNGAFSFNGGGTWGANTKISMSGLSGFHFDTNTNILFGGSGTVSSITSINDANNAYLPLQIACSVLVSGGPVRLPTYTVATLPSAGATGHAKAFVSDSSVTASGNFGNIVSGGGANIVPVYSDGTNWRIG